MKKLLILILSLLFLSGCTLPWMQDADNPQVINVQQMASDVNLASFVLSYSVGKNNVRHIDEWSEFLTSIEELSAGTSIVTYEGLLADMLNLFADDPFYKVLFEKLLVRFDIPALQPPELPYLTEDYLVVIQAGIQGFLQGLEVAQAK